MSKRETLLMSIYLTDNKKLFKTYEDAEKCAEALKAKLEYLRLTKIDYYINAFIGISRTNIRYAVLKLDDNKKPGRNKLIIVPKSFKGAKEKCNEPWHLHIVIEANPGETIAKLVVEYLNKKLKQPMASKKKITRGFFPYTIWQSERIRFVVESRENQLLKYNFKEIYEINFKLITKTQKDEIKRLSKKIFANRLGKTDSKTHKSYNKNNINKSQ